MVCRKTRGRNDYPKCPNGNCADSNCDYCSSSKEENQNLIEKDREIPITNDKSRVP